MIILAAGQGTRLRPLTDDRPKCLVPLQGKPLLEWQIEAAHAEGIFDITVICGYRADQLKNYPVRLVPNPRFETTNMVRSLFCARDHFGQGLVMSYGDIVYSRAVLRRVLESNEAIGVTVDEAWRSYWEERSDDPLKDAETLRIRPDGSLADIGQKPRNMDEIQAQYIGLVAFRDGGVRAMTETYDTLEKDAANPFGGPRNLDQLYMTDLLQGLISEGRRLAAVPIRRGWVEIDNPRDLEVATRYAAAGGLQEV
jgi:L-glutamine-phosphate cytidylyltransferase